VIVVDGPDGKRLEALEAKLGALRARHEPKPAPADQVTQAHAAWRMVIELVVGLLMGLGIGYGLDSLAGTRPLFLVVFALLGFAAGVRVMMRTAAEIGQQNARAERDGKDNAPNGAADGDRTRG